MTGRGPRCAAGTLRICGDAGNSLGAAYPGSRLGMREGVILVGGSAGNDVGLMMRRGLIAVRGPVGVGAGRDMIAGTIVACDRVGAALGVGMKRGTLVSGQLDEEADRRVSSTSRLCRPFAASVSGDLCEAARGTGVRRPGDGFHGPARPLQWRPDGRRPGRDPDRGSFAEPTPGFAVLRL